jgi:hypothetical protein
MFIFLLQGFHSGKERPAMATLVQAVASLEPRLLVSRAVDTNRLSGLPGAMNQKNE